MTSQDRSFSYHWAARQLADVHVAAAQLPRLSVRSSPVRLSPTRCRHALVGIVAVLLLATALPATSVLGQTTDLFTIRADSLSGDYEGIRLPTEWRYQPGDSEAWASIAYVDSSWASVDTRILPGTPIAQAWQGVGWFRFRFEVDSLLVGRPVGLRLEQRGASEVYLDGQLIYRTGNVDPAGGSTVSKLQLFYHVFSASKGSHVLAVRFSSDDVARFNANGSFAGFYAIIVARPNEGNADQMSLVRFHTTFMWFFIGVFGAFALLHAMLFAFHAKAIENLYFAIVLALCGAVSFFQHAFFVSTNPVLRLGGGTVIEVVAVLLAIVSLLFIYEIFYEKRPKQFWFVVAAGGLVLASSRVPGNNVQIGLPFLLVTCIEMLRAVVAAVFRRKPGAWIIGAGIAAFALSFLFILVVESGRFDLSAPVWGEMPFFGILAMTASMSVYLSRGVARTNQNLRQQIVRVQELSEEKTQQEVERKMLAAEYERKLQELEEARALQLSMLPERVPTHSDLELAVFMETATEVGGDYYDFSQTEGGTLTVAVGDATGHGMKAGTMVTATKSLFSAFGGHSDLVSFLRESSGALKRMKLRKLYMALTLARFQDGRLDIASAGMPSTLVWRAATGAVDIVELKGMPLGSFPDFPYRIESIRLEHGDVVLFMSDGFPELFSEAREMLGYDEAVDIFSEVAHGTPEEIISRLVQKGKAWSGSRPTDDDITFVVVRRR